MAIKALKQEPCEDVIDRAEAMTEIMMFTGNVKSDEEDIYIKVSDAVDLLRELPSVTPQTRWIPVSEKLPDEKDYCLCCDKDGYITIGFVSKWSKQWCFDDPEVDIDVIAWMPLPEPYKAESEG